MGRPAGQHRKAVTVRARNVLFEGARAQDGNSGPKVGVPVPATEAVPAPAAATSQQPSAPRSIVTARDLPFCNHPTFVTSHIASGRGQAGSAVRQPNPLRKKGPCPTLAPPAPTTLRRHKRPSELNATAASPPTGLSAVRFAGRHDVDFGFGAHRRCISGRLPRDGATRSSRLPSSI
ncbi:MAG: hypothetical protein QOD24_235 [Solirubrobacteraceae bacterium]|jgi:hypothetical protein|nr:hypothetical protein [Solirubrobacteraceae bacterium]